MIRFRSARIWRAPRRLGFETWWATCCLTGGILVNFGDVFCVSDKGHKTPSNTPSKKIWSHGNMKSHSGIMMIIHSSTLLYTKSHDEPPKRFDCIDNTYPKTSTNTLSTVTPAAFAEVAIHRLLPRRAHPLGASARLQPLPAKSLWSFSFEGPSPQLVTWRPMVFLFYFCLSCCFVFFYFQFNSFVCFVCLGVWGCGNFSFFSQKAF